MKSKNKKILLKILFKIFLVLNISLLLNFFVMNEIYSSTKKNTSSKSVKKTVSNTKKKLQPKKVISKKSKDNKKKKNSNKKKSRKNIKTVPFYSVVVDTNLSEGLKYMHIITGTNKLKHSVHIIEANLKEPTLSPIVLKAKNHSNELDKLQNIICNFDTTNYDKVLCAINANFWRAYSNRPIGPTVSNGEVIEMNTHKQWSSVFFDNTGIPHIDNFFMSATLRKDGVQQFNINSVNRRNDSLGIVVYNKYAGDTIPYIPARTVKKMLDELLTDTTYRDMTDSEFDTIQFLQDIINNERLNTIEYKMPKLVLEYQNSPAVNIDIGCKVLSVDTTSSSLRVPDNGCIVSLGLGIPFDRIPKVGDLLILRYSTNTQSKTVFVNAVSGTPRLVRNGLAKHEAIEEGSRGRRFINRALSRTAFGVDKDREKIYFATIEPTYKGGSTQGANLTQLANIMKKIGCWDAINLDGGGSTIMVVDYKNVLWKKNPDASRRLSVGLGIIKKEELLKNIFK